VWTASFRTEPPSSGEATERHFESPVATTSSWLWVILEHEEGARWYACFRQGRIAHCKAIASADSRNFFVISGGVWYCVDAETQELRSSSGDSEFFDVIVIPGTSFVALADLTSLIIAEPRAILWRTPRIAWDGVRLVSASPTEVLGVAGTGHGPNDDREFRVDLVNRTITGGYAKDFTRR